MNPESFTLICLLKSVVMLPSLCSRPVDLQVMPQVTTANSSNKMILDDTNRAGIDALANIGNC